MNCSAEMPSNPQEIYYMLIKFQGGKSHLRLKLFSPPFVWITAVSPEHEKW